MKYIYEQRSTYEVRRCNISNTDERVANSIIEWSDRANEETGSALLESASPRVLSEASCRAATLISFSFLIF